MRLVVSMVTVVACGVDNEGDTNVSWEKGHLVAFHLGHLEFRINLLIDRLKHLFHALI